MPNQYTGKAAPKQRPTSERVEHCKAWWDGMSHKAKLLLRDVARPIGWWRLEDEEQRSLLSYFDKYVEKPDKK